MHDTADRAGLLGDMDIVDAIQEDRHVWSFSELQLFMKHDHFLGGIIPNLAVVLDLHIEAVLDQRAGEARR